MINEHDQKSAEMVFDAPAPRVVRRAVAIGASAGALDALFQILPAVPAKIPAPILVVVHIPADKESILAELFAARCALRVKEAEDKEEIRDGTIYFAPANYHLQVEPEFILSLSSDEPVLFSRPSIDVLFQTAADVFGPGLTAIVLTGASSDGAAGLRAVLDAGGTGWVQAPETAEVSMMPQAALAANPGALKFTLTEIAHQLGKYAR